MLTAMLPLSLQLCHAVGGRKSPLCPTSEAIQSVPPPFFTPPKQAVKLTFKIRSPPEQGPRGRERRPREEHLRLEGLRRHQGVRRRQDCRLPDDRRQR